MSVSRHHWILLVGAGCVIVAAMGGIALLGNLGRRTGAMLFLWGVAHMAYAAAAWMVLRRGAPRPGASQRTALPVILAVGLIARVLLIPAAPFFSEDVYRYLWDGRLVAHGVNPYPHAPSDPALARFQDDLLRHLNHAEVPTIYPPAAQFLFAAASLVSTTPAAWKVLLLALELILVQALLRLLTSRGLPRERLLLYYWNPLVLVESFGSGHIDLAAAAFLVLALMLYEGRRPARAGIALAAAVLTKYIPGLIIPWLIRRRAWALLAAMALTAALLAAPFLSAGTAFTAGLRIFARHWEFNSAAYHLLREGMHSEVAIRRVLAAAGLLASLVIGWRARSTTGAAYACLMAFLLLSPTVFPWYLVPAVALLPLHPDWGLVAFSGLAALSYLPLPAYRDTGVWTLPAWILWAEYGGLVLAWAAAGVARGWARSRARVDSGSRARASGSRARMGEREHPDIEEPEQVEKEER